MPAGRQLITAVLPDPALRLLWLRRLARSCRPGRPESGPCSGTIRADQRRYLLKRGTFADVVASATGPSGGQEVRRAHLIDELARWSSRPGPEHPSPATRPTPNRTLEWQNRKGEVHVWRFHRSSYSGWPHAPMPVVALSDCNEPSSDAIVSSRLTIGKPQLGRIFSVELDGRRKQRRRGAVAA